MARIESLVINNFRGSSNRLQLDFDKKNPVVVIFGENGTGKTTIADALDAVANNGNGSIGEKSSTKPRDHLPTIGKKPADVSIEICINGKKWKTTQEKDALTTQPQPNPKIRVLRRKHLQDLVEAQPAQRYEVLKGFIDVGQVEKSENSLRDACSNVKMEYDSAVSRRTEIEDQLSKVWIAEGSQGGSAILWAKAIAAQDVVSLETEALLFQEALNTINLAETALEGYKLAIQIFAEKENAAKLVEQQVVSLPNINANQAINLSEILMKVTAYLKADTFTDECPVCQQNISFEQLKSDLHARLEELKPYEEIRTKRNTISQEVIVKRAAIDPKVKELISLAQKLFSLIEKGDNRIFGDESLDLSLFSGLKPDSSDGEDIKCMQAQQLIGQLVPIKQIMESTAKSCTKISGQVNSVRELMNRMDACVSDSEHLEVLLGALNETYKTARLARIEFTQSILDAVASECNQLYAKIHPNEPLAISKLELDQNKRASLNQAVTFEGYNDVSPQAYFSESHLDTLGFCFWLAVAKLESPDKNSIVVLDDVFTSVDAPHINRIAQLITDESKNFAQIIIMTHQRLWRDIYKYSQAPGKKAEIIELQKWSLAKGISNYKAKLALTELVDAIKGVPFDRQSTANKAGILLEATLDYLALRYRCRVPRSPDNSYTLKELIDGTNSLFKKLEIHRPKTDEEGKVLEPIAYDVANISSLMNEIDSNYFVRNQVGAHYNISGSSISDNDVSDFANLAVRLAEELSCRVCGQIPSNKTSTHYQCSCVSPGELRMFPLQV